MKMLLMFLNETDTWQGVPLHQAIVERLRQLGVAGATAQTGVMGYGHHIGPGHKGVFAVSDDRPVTILAIDDEARIRASLPELRRIARHALMVLQDVELVAD